MFSTSDLNRMPRTLRARSCSSAETFSFPSLTLVNTTKLPLGTVSAVQMVRAFSSEKTKIRFRQKFSFNRA